jgi:hypothetical protein
MVVVTCKIPESLDADLEALAEREGVSKSAVLRDALDAHLRRARGHPSRTAYGRLADLCGTLRGPHDLSANPRYLDDLGE